MSVRSQSYSQKFDIQVHWVDLLCHRLLRLLNVFGNYSANFTLRNMTYKTFFQALGENWQNVQ